MKKKKKIIQISIFLLTFLLLAFHAFLFMANVNREKSQPFEIKLVNTEDHVDKKNGVSVEITVSKSWNEKYFGVPCVGAEYDGTITNTNPYPIKDWSIFITTPDFLGRLDSSWNGNYVVEKGLIQAYPDEFTGVVLPGETKTFGFVMDSPGVFDLKEFKFCAYSEKRLSDYPLFWYLSIAGFIWLISVLIFIAVGIRIRSEVKKRQQDENIISQTMQTFASLIDAKDEYTRGHSVRVAQYSALLGKKLKLDEEEIRILGYIALMHDCGKMGIPDAVLNKPDRLLDEERTIIESHTTTGGRILENFTAIPGIREGALYHHERYDGKGYPEGLSGKDIPYYARIICVADSFDAMNSDRCYRKHLSKEVILSELEKCAGSQFDPDIAKAMRELIAEGTVYIR